MRNPGNDSSEDGQVQAPGARTFFGLVRLALGVAILAYLFKSGAIEWHALSRLFTHWPITITAIALLLLDVALIALRLCRLFRPLGMRLPWCNSVQLTLISFYIATFLPGAAGGDIARIFYAAKGNSGRRAEIITVLFLDRGVGLFSLLLLPLLFAPMFPQLMRAAPVIRLIVILVGGLTAAMLGIFLVLLLKPSVMDFAAGQMRRVFPRFSSIERIARTIAAYRSNVGTLFVALMLSLVGNFSMVVVTALGVLAVEPASWSMRLAIVIPVGHVVNSVPLTPGGLGVGESAFNALFELAGLRGGAAALLCYRIWRALVSTLGLVFYLRGFRLTLDGGDVMAKDYEASAAPRLSSE